ncbi:MAG TPA: OmpA family protein [Candidatus Krumholzibacteria bacterium]|nr:OmpA family protein [Candidatus Krumholzibacteria bacterium]
MGRIFRRLTLLALLCLPALAVAAGDPGDMPGSRDPDFLTRMPGFHIYNWEEQEFAAETFTTGANAAESVEGAWMYVDYYANDGIKLPSPLQVIRNYENAVKDAGGQLLHRWEDGGLEYATLKLTKGNAESWVRVEAANGAYKVWTVRRELMRQDVAADADKLAGSLKTTGKAAVYGILFDTGKAVIKPESEAAIAQVAKLLAGDPKLNLYVVGHTDNVGGFDANLTLSQDRAAAVVKVLVEKHGVAAARLVPFGAGPTCPVAPNTDDAGRALNRRVELVAR